MICLKDWTGQSGWRMTQIALPFLRQSTAPPWVPMWYSELSLLTRFGGGIVIGKELIAGHNKIAAEWGHNPLPWATESEQPGPPCYCGNSGCVETCLSGAGLARDHHSRTGQHLTAKEISLAASGGDEYAQESLTVYQDRLARSLAVVINLLDPDVIVLGGGLSNIGQLYAGLTHPSCARLTVI